MTKKTDKKPAEKKPKIDFEEKYLRAAADLQNVRRRADADRATLPTIGKIALFEALLPTIDTAEMATKNPPKKPTEWEKGAIAILGGIFPVLEKMGFEKIAETGVEINPEIHEVLIADGDGKKVVEILQTGWRLGDRVVRAAKVKAG